MAYVRAFGIVIAAAFLGEALRALLPLPIPASVYGMLLLPVALMTGWVKAEKVKPASSILLEIMPMLFIPAMAALPSVWPQLQPVFGPVLIIAITVTFGVMAVTGRVAQRVIHRERRRKDRA